MKAVCKATQVSKRVDRVLEAIASSGHEGTSESVHELSHDLCNAFGLWTTELYISSVFPHEITPFKVRPLHDRSILIASAGDYRSANLLVIILCVAHKKSNMPVSGMNEYWIPNYGINKKVITKEIQCYLGPSATVRPYSFEVGCLLACLQLNLAD